MLKVLILLRKNFISNLNYGTKSVHVHVCAI